MKLVLNEEKCVLIEWIANKEATMKKDADGNWDLDTLKVDGEVVENSFARIADSDNKTIWTIMDEDPKVLN